MSNSWRNLSKSRPDSSLSDRWHYVFAIPPHLFDQTRAFELETRNNQDIRCGGFEWMISLHFHDEIPDCFHLRAIPTSRSHRIVLPECYSLTYTVTAALNPRPQDGTSVDKEEHQWTRQIDGVFADSRAGTIEQEDYTEPRWVDLEWSPEALQSHTELCPFSTNNLVLASMYHRGDGDFLFLRISIHTQYIKTAAISSKRLRSGAPHPPQNRVPSVCWEPVDPMDKPPAPRTDQIPMYVTAVMQTESLQDRLEGTTALRRLLCLKQAPVDGVFETGLLPTIVGFLSNVDDDALNAAEHGTHLRRELQQEAAWIVANMAINSNAVALMVKHGVIERLVAMMRGAHSIKHADIAIWALGNMAAESKEITDRVMNTGFIDDLIASIRTLPDGECLGNAVWTLSNITRRHPPLTAQQVTKMIPAMQRVLRTSSTVHAISPCLWAFHHLSQTESHSEEMVEHGVIDDIVHLLTRETLKYDVALRSTSGATMNGRVYTPCLRFCGRILCGDDTLTQAVLDAGYLDSIEPFLKHSDVQIRDLALWSLSNVMAGPHQQIEAVLSREGLLDSVIEAMSSDIDKIRFQATCCLTNASCNATPTQVQTLADCGTIEALCYSLNPVNELNDENVRIVVESLHDFLRIDGKSEHNHYADRVEVSQGLRYLRDLQADSRYSEETCEAIARLIWEHWDPNHEDKISDLAKNESAD